MKSIRPLKSLTTTILLGLVLAGTAEAKDLATEKDSSQTKTGTVTKTTREIGPDGLATERIVVTEKNGDGTITRIVQVIHPDGTTETRGERRPAQQKS
jgi:hypothetical protein